MSETLRALVAELHAGATAVVLPGSPRLADAAVDLGFSFRDWREKDFEISLVESLLAFRCRFSRERGNTQKISLLVKCAAPAPAGSDSVEDCPASLSALIGALRSGFSQRNGDPVPRLTEAEVETFTEFALTRSGAGRLRVLAGPVSAAWTRRTGSSASVSTRLRARFLFDPGKDFQHGGD